MCEKAPEIGESGPNGYAVVRVGRLPAAYHTGDFSRGYEKAARAFNIGFIGYPSVGNTAITRRYDPKENAICSGLGYYLEALSTHLLAKQGAEFFETSAFPSVPRIIQIDRIGLPAGKPVPAREWLLGLGRGIAYKMKNFILQQSLKQVA